MTNSDLLQYAQKYVNKLEKLIQLGEALYKSFMENEERINYQGIHGIDDYDDDSYYMTSKLDKDKSALWKWQKQCCNVLEQLPIEGTVYQHTLNQILEIDFKNVRGVEIQEITIDLEALKEDYQEGFLDSLMLQAEGEVLSDYLLQAKQFFDEKYYAAAVLLASSALESSLKKLCDKRISEEDKRISEEDERISEEDKTQSNMKNAHKTDPTSLTKLSKLARNKKLIDKVTHIEITKKIVILRNKAAHGDLDFFNPNSEETKETVRDLIVKIEIYIEKYMR